MTQKITVQLNGSEYTLNAGSSILTVLEILDLTGQRVAVERNGSVVPRSQHGDTQLATGDQLEVIRAVGGG
ncbi:sulfur carrier protein ThiS [Acidithiobacillus sp. IBUN Pt1247-S3]|uniref:sulfur carrier protein ThiS n=1 Tax=Acidithiobacillus sp. IBUN Pt1247-S3 TaxID=3166642 RepID=UPI0034E51F55